MLRLLAGLISLAAPAGAQSTATLSGIDLYRSEQVTVDQIRAKFGTALEQYAALQNERKNVKAVRRAQRLRADIERGVSAMGSFAYVGLYYGESMSSARHASYLTIDLVDSKDAGSRLPFRPVPEGTAADPDGLLAAWDAYSDLGAALRMRGELPFDRPKCAAFYCLWGPATPELAAYEKSFSEGVFRDKVKLLEVLAKEADPGKRAAAVYLLSYLPEGSEVARIATDALRDPHEEVRAAGLQVLADIAVYSKDVPLSPELIVPAVDFPTASDRSKALGVLVGMSQNPLYRTAILKQAAHYLPRLLRMQQPTNHDMAFTLLGMISRETFGRRDYEAWENWLYRNAAKSSKN